MRRFRVTGFLGSPSNERNRLRGISCFSLISNELLITRRSFASDHKWSSKNAETATSTKKSSVIEKFNMISRSHAWEEVSHLLEDKFALRILETEVVNGNGDIYVALIDFYTVMGSPKALELIAMSQNNPKRIDRVTVRRLVDSCRVLAEHQKQPEEFFRNQFTQIFGSWVSVITCDLIAEKLSYLVDRKEILPMGVTLASLIGELILHLSKVLHNRIEKGKMTLFYTYKIGDVALFILEALVKQNNIDEFVQIVSKLVSDGHLSALHFSDRHFKDVINRVVRSSYATNGGSGDGLTATKPSDQILNLFSIITRGHSAKAVVLRELYLSCFHEKGYPDLVTDIAIRMKSEGFLLGSGGYNMVLSAYVKIRDSNGISSTLEDMNNEVALASDECGAYIDHNALNSIEPNSNFVFAARANRDISKPTLPNMKIRSVTFGFNVYSAMCLLKYDGSQSKSFISAMNEIVWRMIEIDRKIKPDGLLLLALVHSALAIERYQYCVKAFEYAVSHFTHSAEPSVTSASSLQANVSQLSGRSRITDVTEDVGTISAGDVLKIFNVIMFASRRSERISHDLLRFTKAMASKNIEMSEAESLLLMENLLLSNQNTSVIELFTAMQHWGWKRRRSHIKGLILAVIRLDEVVLAWSVLKLTEKLSLSLSAAEMSNDILLPPVSDGNVLDRIDPLTGPANMPFSVYRSVFSNALSVLASDRRRNDDIEEGDKIVEIVAEIAKVIAAIAARDGIGNEGSIKLSSSLKEFAASGKVSVYSSSVVSKVLDSIRIAWADVAELNGIISALQLGGGENA